MPTYAEALSMVLVRALNTALESVLFSSIVYWMIGYYREAGGGLQAVLNLCISGPLALHCCIARICVDNPSSAQLSA